MIKRGGVEDGGQERNKILDEVEKLIFDGDIKKVKISVISYIKLLIYTFK